MGRDPAFRRCSSTRSAAVPDGSEPMVRHRSVDAGRESNAVSAAVQSKSGSRSSVPRRQSRNPSGMLARLSDAVALPPLISSAAPHLHKPCQQRMRVKPHALPAEIFGRRPLDVSTALDMSGRHTHGGVVRRHDTGGENVPVVVLLCGRVHRLQTGVRAWSA